MTSIKGDPRGIMGIPEEDWFETLASSSDWRALGIADRPDRDETQRVFADLWALAQRSMIPSMPHEFHVVPGSLETAAAMNALRAIGALEVIEEIDKGRPEPPPPLPIDADPKAERAYQLQEREYDLAMRRWDHGANRFSKDIRAKLIGYLDARGVFPLDDSRERLEEIWGEGRRKHSEIDKETIRRLTS